MKKYFLFLAIIMVLASCSVFQKSGGVKAPSRVQIETDSGTMVFKLYSGTPLHTENFLKLAKEHYFDGILFHRVIKNFMIQGGDPDSKDAKPGELLGEGGLPYTVAAEFDTAYFHKKGALAMAREGDSENPSKASSSTQFYIVEGKKFTDEEMDKVEEKMKIKIPENHRQVYRTLGGTPFLDMNYTVFGEMESGFEVLEKIASTAKDDNDRPLKDIKMKITVLKR